MADVTTTTTAPAPTTTVTVSATTTTPAGDTVTSAPADITDAPALAALTVAVDPVGVPIDPATGKLPASIVPMAAETRAALATKAPLDAPVFTGTMDLTVARGGVPPAPAADLVRFYARDTGSGVPAPDVVTPDGFRFRLGRDLFAQVHNDTGRTLQRGRVVYIVTEKEITPGVRLPCVEYARADAMATLPAFGWLAEDLAPGQAGRVQKAGRLVPVDTRGRPLAAQLFVSATEAGGVTTSPPGVWQQVVGTVLSVGPGSAGPAPFGAIDVALRSVLPAPAMVGGGVDLTGAVIDGGNF
jgi:hypothetical protein